ncbi:MAG: hypothetical protein P4M00_00455 [Azospirillaceae bacterium]|nr:hypothetical protein [Azospirillaceae bacterium]
MTPFVADREQTSKIDLFTPNLTLPASHQDAGVAVMRQASWVVIDRNWTEPQFLHEVSPATGDLSCINGATAVAAMAPGS